MATQTSSRRWLLRPRLWFFVGFASLALHVLAFPFHVEYFTNAGTIFCLDSGNFSIRWWRLDDRFETSRAEGPPVARLNSERPGWEATLRGTERDHPLWDSPNRNFIWVPEWKVTDFGHFPEMVFADNSPRQIAGRYWRCELVVPMWYLAAASFFAAVACWWRNRRRADLNPDRASPRMES